MESYRSHYSLDVTSKDFGKSITVAGWVEDIRNIGSIAFVILRDRKGTLQITIFKKNNSELFDRLVDIPRESVISVSGVCNESDKARNGYEIIPKEVEVLSSAETPLPLGVVDKVESELDTRLDNRFIDLRKQEIQSIFKIRDVVINAVHEFLRNDGFIQGNLAQVFKDEIEKEFGRCGCLAKGYPKVEEIATKAYLIGFSQSRNGRRSFNVLIFSSQIFLSVLIVSNSSSLFENSSLNC